MAETAAATTEQNQGPRPIIPFLVLDDPPYLAGVRCTHCGATYLRSGRVACAKCGEAGPFENVKLSDHGTLYVYSIVHQSAPGIPVPYVAAIVDLPEQVAVRCTIVDVRPDPAALPFGMPLKMITRKVRTDKEGRDVIAFFFTPAQ